MFISPTKLDETVVVNKELHYFSFAYLKETLEKILSFADVRHVSGRVFK